MIRKTILSAILAWLGATGACADDLTQSDSAATVLRPVFAAYTVEWGSSHLTDTYLTPLKYDGWHAAFDYQRYQAMKFAPRDWTMRLSLNLA